jgi:hypothetical protein
MFILKDNIMSTLTIPSVTAETICRDIEILLLNKSNRYFNDQRGSLFDPTTLGLIEPLLTIAINTVEEYFENIFQNYRVYSPEFVGKNSTALYFEVTFTAVDMYNEPIEKRVIIAFSIYASNLLTGILPHSITADLNVSDFSAEINL